MSWDPCYVNPSKGISFFDGIEIVADSITDPRLDRVLPILEEEQVYMCRAMKPLLKDRPLVLDVGTGSGVFAIWAASMGCKVVAIDISPRALRTTRENIRKNNREELKIVETSSLEELLALPTDGPGAILVEHRSLDTDFLKSPFGKTYDIVILAPPYNPTADGVFPALHASAGKLGQDEFNRQVELAAKLVGPGGRIIGNQMTPSYFVDGEQNVEAATKLKTELGPDSKIEFQRIIPADISIELFLQLQYHNYLKEEKWVEPVNNYIQDQVKAKPDANFALIYYEAQKLEESTFVKPIEVPAQFRTSRTWDDRTWLHRQIVDHTSRSNSFPSPSLFMDAGPGGKVIRLPGGKSFGDNLLDRNEQRQPFRRVQDSVMRQIDAYVSRVGLVAEKNIDVKEPLFDILVIDAAPWFGRTEGEEFNYEECKAWASSPNGTQVDYTDLLVSWQANTKEQQLSGLSLFLHPHFVGQNASDVWSEIAFPTTSTNSDEHLAFASNLVDQGIWGKIIDRRHKFRQSPDAESELAKVKDFHYDGVSGYSSTTLESISVASNARSQTENVNFDIREYLKSYDLQEAYQMAAQHYHLTHLAMLHQLHKTIPGTVGKDDAGWSTLAGLPLRLAFGNEDPDVPQESSVLQHFRGGIWVYAHSRQHWSHAHEAALKDFLRFSWLVFQSYYNVQAVHILGEYQKTISVAKYARGASHSLKTSILAAQAPLLGVGKFYRELFGPNSEAVGALVNALGTVDEVVRLRNYLHGGVRLELAMEFLQRQAQTMFWIMDPSRMRRELLLDPRQADWTAGEIATMVRLAFAAGIKKSSEDLPGKGVDLVKRVIDCEFEEAKGLPQFVEQINVALEGRLNLACQIIDLNLFEIDKAVAENILFELLVNASARAIISEKGYVRFSMSSDAQGSSCEISVQNSASETHVKNLLRDWPNPTSKDETVSSGVAGLHQINILPIRAQKAKEIDQLQRPKGDSKTLANTSKVQLISPVISGSDSEWQDVTIAIRISKGDLL